MQLEQTALLCFLNLDIIIIYVDIIYINILLSQKLKFTFPSNQIDSTGEYRSRDQVLSLNRDKMEFFFCNADVFPFAEFC